jgi:hypothetical protein
MSAATVDWTSRERLVRLARESLHLRRAGVHRRSHAGTRVRLLGVLLAWRTRLTWLLAPVPALSMPILWFHSVAVLTRCAPLRSRPHDRWGEPRGYDAGAGPEPSVASAGRSSSPSARTRNRVAASPASTYSAPIRVSSA